VVYVDGATVGDSYVRTALGAIANEIDRPLIVYGGDRTEQRNTEVHGARLSRHLFGSAADVRIDGLTKREIADLLYHSSARQAYGINLVYHGPGASLPEHSHLEAGGSGRDLLQQPKGAKPRYVPLTDPSERQ